MPSFSEIIGVIVALIMLTLFTGHRQVLWKAIGEARQAANAQVRQEWGCPSIFTGRAACMSYNGK